jgi:hypothetical protein
MWFTICSIDLSRGSNDLLQLLLLLRLSRPNRSKNLHPRTGWQNCTLCERQTHTWSAINRQISQVLVALGHLLRRLSRLGHPQCLPTLQCLSKFLSPTSKHLRLVSTGNSLLVAWAPFQFTATKITARNSHLSARPSFKFNSTRIRILFTDIIYEY